MNGKWVLLSLYLCTSGGCSSPSYFESPAALQGLSIGDIKLGMSLEEVNRVESKPGVLLGKETERHWLSQQQIQYFQFPDCSVTFVAGHVRYVVGQQLNKDGRLRLQVNDAKAKVSALFGKSRKEQPVIQYVDGLINIRLKNGLVEAIGLGKPDGPLTPLQH